MSVFARCGIDLLLAGHFHRSDSGETSTRYPLDGYSALVVQAGRAISTRGRGEASSFNVIQAQRDEIAVQPWQWEWARARFAPANAKRIRRDGECWLETA